MSETNDQNQATVIQTTTEKPKMSHLLTLGLIFVLIVLGIFFWTKIKIANKPKTQTNANDIRQTFNVSNGSVAGAFTPPSGDLNTAATQYQNSGQNVSPRGQGSIPIQDGQNPSPNPQGQSPMPPANSEAQTYIYNNTTFAFQMTLPSDFKTWNNSDSPIFFYNSTSGQTIGTMEIYNNTDNSTLTDVENSLRGSTDVTTVNKTTLGGQPALSFSTNSQFKNGIAVIYKNRIYYIRGELASPSIENSFKFL